MDIEKVLLPELVAIFEASMRYAYSVDRLNVSSVVSLDIKLGDVTGPGLVTGSEIT